MRWGVRDEMTNEHMTTALCMTEVLALVVGSKYSNSYNQQKNKQPVFDISFSYEIAKNFPWDRISYILVGKNMVTGKSTDLYTYGL